MTQTFRRELRLKLKPLLLDSMVFGLADARAEELCIEEKLSAYSDELIEKLADAALEVIYKPTGISNKIFAGLPVTEEDLEQDNSSDQAPKMFEKAFGFGTLPWYSNDTWTKFAKFVIEEYRKSKISFGNYVAWRADEGKYTGMSNKQIRTNPAAFMDTGWPEFQSQVVRQVATLPQEKTELQKFLEENNAGNANHSVFE
jgi:hypothetical protein